MNKYFDYDLVKASAYAKNASRYKRIVEKLPKSILQRLFPVIGFIQVFPGMRVLDIGSGSGLYSHILRTRFQCQCLEVEPHMSNHYDMGDYVVRADVFNLPKAGKFDTVLLVDVLEHLNSDEIDALFLTIDQILSPGGQVYIKVPNASSLAGLESSVGDLTHVRQFNSISLGSLVKQHHFTVTRMCGIGPNLTPRRILLQLLSMPFDILMKLHLKARGCSGVLLAPAIMAELRHHV